MESNKIIGNEWLCRNCNSLVDNSVEQCPHCHASRPEGEANEDSQESNDEVVERDNYSNATPLPKAKYNFREGVLVNSADIILILGLFCTFGAIIAPNFIDIEINNTMMWAVCIAVVIFAVTMILWAALRTLAEVSRMLRNRE
jgi:hypothetical protein